MESSGKLQVGVELSITAEVTPPLTHHRHHSSPLLRTPASSIASSPPMSSTAAGPQGSRDSSSAPVQKSVKHLTCFFWRTFGQCKYTDENCLYAHHHTGALAAGPVKLEEGRPAVAGVNAQKPRPVYSNWRGMMESARSEAKKALPAKPLAPGLPIKPLAPSLLQQINRIHQKAAAQADVFQSDSAASAWLNNLESSPAQTLTNTQQDQAFVNQYTDLNINYRVRTHAMEHVNLGNGGHEHFANQPVPFNNNYREHNLRDVSNNDYYDRNFGNPNMSFNNDQHGHEFTNQGMGFNNNQHGHEFANQGMNFNNNQHGHELANQGLGFNNNQHGRELANQGLGLNNNQHGHELANQGMGFNNNQHGREMANQGLGLNNNQHGHEFANQGMGFNNNQHGREFANQGMNLNNNNQHGHNLTNHGVNANYGGHGPTLANQPTNLLNHTLNELNRANEHARTMFRVINDLANALNTCKNSALIASSFMQTQVLALIAICGKIVDEGGPHHEDITRSITALVDVYHQQQAVIDLVMKTKVTAQQDLRMKEPLAEEKLEFFRFDEEGRLVKADMPGQDEGKTE